MGKERELVRSRNSRPVTRAEHYAPEEIQCLPEILDIWMSSLPDIHAPLDACQGGALSKLTGLLLWGAVAGF